MDDKQIAQCRAGLQRAKAAKAYYDAGYPTTEAAAYDVDCWCREIDQHLTRLEMLSSIPDGRRGGLP